MDDDRVAARAEERLAVGCAAVAGCVDAYGYLTCRVYPSLMGGNTTQAGSHLVRGAPGSTIAPEVAILCFLGGVFGGTLAGHLGARPALALLGSAALLGLTIAVASLETAPTEGIVALLALAMGFTNTALGHVGAQRVNVVAATGTLVSLARHAALGLAGAPLPDSRGAWDTHARRARVVLAVWSSLLAGAALAGVATPRLEEGVLVAPVVALVALALTDRPP